MNLSGQDMVLQEIITGPIADDNVSQHSVDLNVIEIKQIKGDIIIGAVFRDRKTIVCNSDIIAPKRISLLEQRENVVQMTPFPEKGDRPFEEIQVNGWLLQPGSYHVTFSQGCNIPFNQRMLIVQRSSLMRNGSFINSSFFDAGYSCQYVGTVLFVTVPIFIEYNARIGTAYCEASNRPHSMYNGQWQGGKENDRA